jgi:hypothetical protein
MHVMTPRRRETFPPVTLGHIRGHGCRNLVVYCQSGWCHHNAVINADWLPDDVPVRSFCPRMVCTACGHDRSRCAAGLVAAYEQLRSTIRAERWSSKSACLRSRCCRAFSSAPINIEHKPTRNSCHYAAESDDDAFYRIDLVSE